jgi:uncharacterized membrane protein YeaQ/YmgE (transglycosylase-associated protein family)
MDTIVNLIIQLISGVVGGNAAAAALKDYNLGNLGNTIAGAIGGVGGGRRRRHPHGHRWAGEEHDGPAAGAIMVFAGG